MDLTVEEIVHTDLLDGEALDWVFEKFKHHNLVSIIRCDELEATTYKVIYFKKPDTK